MNVAAVHSANPLVIWKPMALPITVEVIPDCLESSVSSVRSTGPESVCIHVGYGFARLANEIGASNVRDVSTRPGKLTRLIRSSLQVTTVMRVPLDSFPWRPAPSHTRKRSKDYIRNRRSGEGTRGHVPPASGGLER